LLDISESNTASYRKILQLMHKTIKQVDSTVLIVKCKEEDEEITEVNENGITVKAKNALLNYTEVLP